MTVSKNWYPVDAFVRLSIDEKLVGSSWFRFTDSTAECQGFTAKEGRLGQHFDTGKRIGFFGAHPLHGDAWACATLQRDESMDSSRELCTFSSSHLPNGGSGPMLVPTPPGFLSRKYIGDERIDVAAGSFETGHFQFLVADKPPIEIWATGPDFIPVRMRWDLLKQSYELVELEGDPAINA